MCKDRDDRCRNEVLIPAAVARHGKGTVLKVFVGRGLFRNRGVPATLEPARRGGGERGGKEFHGACAFGS